MRAIIPISIRSPAIRTVPCGERTVRIYHEAGVPYEKMVLGAAFYGRRWAGVVDGGTHGLGQKASTVGNIRTEFDLQDEKAVAANRFTKLWDDNAKAAYLYDGADFISYETPESISAKCDFIREKGLAGLMYWAYGNTRCLKQWTNIWIDRFIRNAVSKMSLIKKEDFYMKFIKWSTIVATREVCVNR